MAEQDSSITSMNTDPAPFPTQEPAQPSRFRRFLRRLGGGLKRIVILGIVFGIAYFVWTRYNYVFTGKGSIPGQIGKLENRIVVQKIVTEAEIRPVVSQTYRTDVNSAIEKLLVKEGQPVKKGDLLVILTSPELVENRAKSQDQMAEAEKRLKELKDIYQKAILLYQRDLGSQQSVLQAQKEMEKFQSTTYEQAVQSYEKIQKDVQSLKIYADFDGYVIEQTKFEGDPVIKGENILTIAQLDRLYARIYVSTLFKTQLSPGLAVTYYPPVGQKDVPVANGTISLVSTFIAKKGVMVELSFQAKSDQEAMKYLNQNLPTEIILAKTGDPVPSIPLSALYVNNNQYYIYILENNVTVKRPVQIGIIGYDYAQLVSGLKPTEQFAIATTAYLEPGMAVKKE